MEFAPLACSCVHFLEMHFYLFYDIEIVQSLVYAIQYVFEKIYVCRLTPGVQMDGAQPGKKTYLIGYNYINIFVCYYFDLFQQALS